MGGRMQRMWKQGHYLDSCSNNVDEREWQLGSE